MPRRREITFIQEDTEILFHNFSGKMRPPFNREGDRNFSVILDEEMARQMLDDGWNVKGLDEEEKDPYIQIKVNYSVKPPFIVLITSNDRKLINEDNVGMLDSLDFSRVDVMCNGSKNPNNTTGPLVCYLRTMFLTLDEDPRMRKYGMTDFGFSSMAEEEDFGDRVGVD